MIAQGLLKAARVGGPLGVDPGEVGLLLEAQLQVLLLELLEAGHVLLGFGGSGGADGGAESTNEVEDDPVLLGLEVVELLTVALLGGVDALLLLPEEGDQGVQTLSALILVAGWR